MIRKVFALPWGRLACLLGTLASASGLLDSGGTSLPSAIALVGFLFSGVTLHWIAAYRAVVKKIRLSEFFKGGPHRFWNCSESPQQTPSPSYLISLAESSRLREAFLNI
jgi:hypothetical protein